MQYRIIVEHSLGIRTDYEIESANYWDAEKEAKQRFVKEFCGGTLSTFFRGEETKHTLKAFTIDKYKTING